MQSSPHILIYILYLFYTLFISLNQYTYCFTPLTLQLTLIEQHQWSGYTLYLTLTHWIIFLPLRYEYNYSNPPILIHLTLLHQPQYYWGVNYIPTHHFIFFHSPLHSHPCSYINIPSHLNILNQPQWSGETLSITPRQFIFPSFTASLYFYYLLLLWSLDITKPSPFPSCFCRK